MLLKCKIFDNYQFTSSQLLGNSLSSSVLYFDITILKNWPSCNFIKKENLSQVLSCEFCKIFKDTIFIENLQWLPLVISQNSCKRIIQNLAKFSVLLRVMRSKTFYVNS